MSENERKRDGNIEGQWRKEHNEHNGWGHVDRVRR
jgi:hypothetical protein